MPCDTRHNDPFWDTRSEQCLLRRTCFGRPKRVDVILLQQAQDERPGSEAGSRPARQRVRDRPNQGRVDNLRRSHRPKRRRGVRIRLSVVGLPVAAAFGAEITAGLGAAVGFFGTQTSY